MADLQASLAKFVAEDVDVCAASVDDLAAARKTVDADRLTFTVGYGLDTKQTARMLGSFYQERPDGSSFLHPADFIIQPNGTIVAATYSTSPIGRITADDALRLIAIRKKAAR